MVIHNLFLLTKAGLNFQSVPGIITQGHGRLDLFCNTNILTVTEIQHFTDKETEKYMDFLRQVKC